jgi:lipoprotein-anchoring transpeptidase ErfK/SrfK
MSNVSITSRRNPFKLILALALICVVAGVAAWTATSSPAKGLKGITTPTLAKPFAFVEIAKQSATQENLAVSNQAPTTPPTELSPQVSSPSPNPTENQVSMTFPTELPAAFLPNFPTENPSPIAFPTTSVIVPSTTSPDQIILASETPSPSDSSEPQVYAKIVEDTSFAQFNAPVPAYDTGKYILVDISEQHMYVYEGNTLANSFVSSTGMNYATRVGSFSVLDKIPNAYGATWDIWMPNWLGIYWAGNMENGIHALPILPSGATLWAGYLGTPISYGCIVLGTYDAQWLYDWVDIGTPVEIRW